MSQPQFASPKDQAAKRPARRKTELLPDGALLFEDEFTGGAIDTTLITCTGWLLELHELTSGRVLFFTRSRKVSPATNCFVILYPPFTMTHLCFENPRGRVSGIAASEPLPPEFARTPIVFDTTCTAPPVSVSSACELLRGGANREPVDVNPTASLLSVKAKRLIDTNYLDYPSIARIAERLGVSHAHLSRQFRTDFSMSPSEYLRRLRVADAPLRLARGEAIIKVSHDVGYNDLSRFYKQFRKTTNTSPGVCKTLLGSQR